MLQGVKCRVGGLGEFSHSTGALGPVMFVDYLTVCMARMGDAPQDSFPMWTFRF